MDKFFNSLQAFWRENRWFLLFLGLVVIPVKSSLADWNWVPTGSMKPNILEGDLIFVNKAAYDLRVPLTLHRLHKHDDPKRGDIVVCFSPDDGTRLVKRVVGIPGDVLEMRNNHLIINGSPANISPLGKVAGKSIEPGLRDASNFANETIAGHSRTVMETPVIPSPYRSFAPQRIPTGQYFLVGDNRDNSRDSREFGTIARHLIIGKAKRVVMSFNKMDKLQPRIGRWFSELN